MCLKHFVHPFNVLEFLEVYQCLHTSTNTATYASTNDINIKNIAMACPYHTWPVSHVMPHAIVRIDASIKPAKQNPFNIFMIIF